MARVFVYTIVLSTLMIITSMAGLGISSDILSMFGYEAGASGWNNSLFIITMVGIIGGAAAFGIVTGVFGRSPDPTYIIGGAITGFLIFFIVDMGSIVSYAYTNYPDMSWIGNILSVLFFGLTAGYGIALYQWWRGIDP